MRACGAADTVEIQDRYAGVPQIVKPDTRQAGPIQQFVEAVCQVCVTENRANRAREHKIMIGPARPQLDA